MRGLLVKVYQTKHIEQPIRITQYALDFPTKAPTHAIRGKAESKSVKKPKKKQQKLDSFFI